MKKFKESNGARSFLQPRKLVSDKDSLVGDIPSVSKHLSLAKIGRKDMSQKLRWSLELKVWLR